jgi:lipopolysaccharide/colanic/teichoic acid biosynthesis glycosyltransferase
MPSMTLTGKIVHRLRLDRLPLALALVAGNMSLVGPRATAPDTFSRLECESPVFRLRTLVKPGLLGWEQLHRESRSSYDTLRPLEYDLYYIKHYSLRLDLLILARSAAAFVGLGTGTRC